MASGTRLLLRLPPCLRQQLLAQEAAIKRTFASSTKPIRRSKATPQNVPPKSSAPTRSTPTTAAASPTPAPAARVGRAFIDTYEPLSEKVLLYASPSHGSFFASSYLIGGFLLFGGYSYAELFLKERPGQQTPWLLKGVSALTTMCVVGFGTVFILAPRNMIKSISIVSSKASDKAATQGPRVLRLEVKRALPFLKPDVLKTSPKRVFLDREVPMAVQGLNYHNVLLSEAQAFTQEYFAPTQAKKNSAGAAIASFNGSLLATWPAVKRETRRMFLRDQMAYVEVEGNGRFKLDLQNCYMLDMGRPLHRIITASTSARPNVWRWFSGLFSDNAGKGGK